jgi:hypothetical protein
MRQWLRFTVPLYDDSSQGEKSQHGGVPISTGLNSRVKTAHPSPTVLPSLPKEVDSMLGKVTRQAHMQVDTNICQQVVSNLEEVLAWITSTPVKTRYIKLDPPARVIFGAWVRYLNQLPRRLAYAVGPIISCSYLVGLHQ